MSMQYTKIFKVVKMKIFNKKIFDIFLIFDQNIDCGYTLKPPRRGCSTEYPQSMSGSKNKKKKKKVPLHTPILIYKMGVLGGIYFMDMFS